eukprot:TRINITY_DN13163_c2_g1_i13.p1 TRINITY_DN13163_c2_g1~~TRINITY_DN13163_c2_g1_i13.p1  ORF type:complete len:2168 (+),score=591.74 TRINITY_DN13163_c2_g1_i13:263-6766(+)
MAVLKPLVLLSPLAALVGAASAASTATPVKTSDADEVNPLGQVYDRLKRVYDTLETNVLNNVIDEVPQSVPKLSGAEEIQMSPAESQAVGAELAAIGPSAPARSQFSGSAVGQAVGAELAAIGPSTPARSQSSRSTVGQGVEQPALHQEAPAIFPPKAKAKAVRQTGVHQETIPTSSPKADKKGKPLTAKGFKAQAKLTHLFTSVDHAVQKAVGETAKGVLDGVAEQSQRAAKSGKAKPTGPASAPAKAAKSRKAKPTGTVSAPAKAARSEKAKPTGAASAPAKAAKSRKAKPTGAARAPAKVWGKRRARQIELPSATVEAGGRRKTKSTAVHSAAAKAGGRRKTKSTAVHSAAAKAGGRRKTKSTAVQLAAAKALHKIEALPGVSPLATGKAIRKIESLPGASPRAVGKAVSPIWSELKKVTSLGKTSPKLQSPGTVVSKGKVPPAPKVVAKGKVLPAPKGKAPPTPKAVSKVTAHLAEAPLFLPKGKLKPSNASLFSQNISHEAEKAISVDDAALKIVKKALTASEQVLKKVVSRGKGRKKGGTRHKVAQKYEKMWLAPRFKDRVLGGAKSEYKGKGTRNGKGKGMGKARDKGEGKGKGKRSGKGNATSKGKGEDKGEDKGKGKGKGKGNGRDKGKGKGKGKSSGKDHTSSKGKGEDKGEDKGKGKGKGKGNGRDKGKGKGKGKSSGKGHTSSKGEDKGKGKGNRKGKGRAKAKDRGKGKGKGKSSGKGNTTSKDPPHLNGPVPKSKPNVSFDRLSRAMNTARGSLKKATNTVGVSARKLERNGGKCTLPKAPQVRVAEKKEMAPATFGQPTAAVQAEADLKKLKNHLVMASTLLDKAEKNYLSVNGSVEQLLPRHMKKGKKTPTRMQPQPKKHSIVSNKKGTPSIPIILHSAHQSTSSGKASKKDVMAVAASMADRALSSPFGFQPDAEEKAQSTTDEKVRPPKKTSKKPTPHRRTGKAKIKGQSKPRHRKQRQLKSRRIRKQKRPLRSSHSDHHGTGTPSSVFGRRVRTSRHDAVAAPNAGTSRGRASSSRDVRAKRLRQRSAVLLSTAERMSAMAEEAEASAKIALKGSARTLRGAQEASRRATTEYQRSLATSQLREAQMKASRSKSLRLRSKALTRTANFLRRDASRMQHVASQLSQPGASALRAPVEQRDVNSAAARDHNAGTVLAMNSQSQRAARHRKGKDQREPTMPLATELATAAALALQNATSSERVASEAAALAARAVDQQETAMMNEDEKPPSVVEEEEVESQADGKVDERPGKNNESASTAQERDVAHPADESEFESETASMVDDEELARAVGREKNVQASHDSEKTPAPANNSAVFGLEEEEENLTIKKAKVAMPEANRGEGVQDEKKVREKDGEERKEEKWEDRHGVDELEKDVEEAKDEDEDEGGGNEEAAKGDGKKEASELIDREQNVTADSPKEKIPKAANDEEANVKEYGHGKDGADSEEEKDNEGKENKEEWEEEEEEEKAKENQKEKEKKMEAEEEKENTKVAKAEENHKAEERELVMEVKKEIVEERKQEVAAEEDAPLDIAASRQPKAAIATSSYDEVADLKATATTAEVADAVKRADAAEEAAQVFSERIETLELARADAVDQAQQAEQKLAEVHEALKTARITEARLRRENEDMEQEMRNAQSLWREQVKAAEKRGDEAMKELKRELSEFRKHSSKIEAERDTLLGESKKAAVREKRLVEENKDMEKELYQAQDRWRQQIQLAEQRAESAQCDGKGTTQRLTEQLRATEAEKEALLAALEKSSNSEQRVREDNKDMERELYQAQERWREQIRVAERRAEEASAQCQHHMQEAEGLRKQIAEAAVEESEFRQRVEDELKTGRLDFDRRGEELRAANEIEGQLRRELALTDRARMLLDERIAELELQLERAQTAYTAAAEEIAAMQSRSDELEFGSYDKTNSEELLLRELEGFRERHTELEKRLSEVTWMRDYARTQAEEARAEAQRCREEAQRAQEEQRNSVVAANLVVAASGRDGGEESPIASSRARLDAAEARHADEQKRALALHSEELDHLRKRIEEKDRRLEILTCERNAFRLQCSEQPPPVSVVSSNRAKPKKASATGADKAGDLEEGLQLRSRLGDSEDFQSAATNCSKDVDMLLRRFSRLLFISPTTRSLFYGYLALIHIWVWVVLHHTAATRQ